MAEPLKNIYSPAFFDRFIQVIQTLEPAFSKDNFLNKIFDTDWEERALKSRMRHVTLVLESELQGTYAEKVDLLLNSIPILEREVPKTDRFGYIFYPDFIEVFGVEDLKTAIKAFPAITQFITCEFAVRPFILKYQNEMIETMYEWTNHEHHAVRRLATEGCRPRLPWAMALPFLKADPSPILPILEQLKNDASDSVRLSVANNLNDIAKDNPDTMIEIAQRWKGETKAIDWLVKHASRTLLKQGNQTLMTLFGFGAVKDISIRDFKILTPRVEIGGALAFKFKLVNNSATKLLIRLEYGVFYQKANGSLSQKVYKISEKWYDGNSEIHIERKQAFKPITTRKFHLGLHQVCLIINGQPFEKFDFELI